MRSFRLIGLSALLVALAAPAAGQNSTTPPAGTPPGTRPPATNPPPPAAPPATAPPVTVVVPVEPPPVENQVVVREPAPPPPEPVTIDPDAAYPNGFADPADPFGNDLSLARRDAGGFDWGLLGLLGLFGLIPLFRRATRTTRTVYVDRDEPRRVIREEETKE